MDYDAITLDTNVFYRNGGKLETGMLAQLSQFKEGSVQLLLSEIVHKELQKFLNQEAREASEVLAKAVRKSQRHGVLVKDAVEYLKDINKITSPADDATQRRLDAFADATGAEIVPANLADLVEVVGRYFATEPPFGATADKKSEFPDAIALLSLEAWAKRNQKRILAISHDVGWVEFGKRSDWIDVEQNLTTAFGRFQKHKEQAERFINELLARIEDGKWPEALEQISESLADDVAGLYVFGEAQSGFHVEYDHGDLVYEDFRFVQNGEKYDFQIVQSGKSKVVARVKVRITTNAVGSFEFQVHDSIDDDFVSLGSTTVQRKFEFDGAALLTLEGDFNNHPEEVIIESVELIGNSKSVDFGLINFDLPHDDEPDDF